MRCLHNWTSHRALILSQLLLLQTSTSNGFLSSSGISQTILPSISSSSQKTTQRAFCRTIIASTASNDFIPDESRGVEDEQALQKRLGQAKNRVQKSVSRENRVASLEKKLNDTIEGRANAQPISDSERAELNGLLKVTQKFEEQYDPLTFTEEHLEFKQMHNDVFIALSQYCQQKRNHAHLNLDRDDKSKLNRSINIFFLDGPDGGTASSLIEKGEFLPSQCFVANRHESSCNSLRISGGGRLPDENVIHSSAAEALMIMESAKGASLGLEEFAEQVETCSFSNVDFAAYYFDGCGGFVPQIIDMISAALSKENCHYDQMPIAVGYSIVGGNKDVVEKELEVSRSVTVIARRRGMRTVHALDDYERYGISSKAKKIGGSGGGTFTTWLVLEPNL